MGGCTVPEARQWVKKDPNENNVFWPTDELKQQTWVSDESIYNTAKSDP